MNDEGHKASQGSGTPRRRKRRWRRRLVILLLVLAVLIWSGPYIASTDMARDMIVSAANSRIYGTVRIDDISLSWLGPCAVKGLRVVDTSDREVLYVEQIIWDHGVWRGIMDYEKIGHVEVVKPNPKLIEDSPGEFSLVKALSPRKPSEKKPRPELKGRITVRDGNVSVALQNGKTVEVSGINHQFDLKTLKDIAGKFSWDSVETYGLVLEKATFSPTLRNDLLNLPVTTIGVSTSRESSGQTGGRLRIGCTIDFSGPEPMLTIPGSLQVVENLPIDRKIASEFLSRILTIFYEPQRLTGRVSLTVEDIALPLGKSIKHTGSGRGHLALRDVKIHSGELMTNLTNLGGLAPANLVPMRITDLDFEIKDGRIHYDNLSVIYAEVFEMKFWGSVGFDDTLDLAVSLPILPRQLEKLRQVISPDKLGATIGLEELDQLLEKLPVPGGIPLLGRFSPLGIHRLSIRITGTRQKPVLDLLGSLGTTLNPKPTLPNRTPKSRPATKPSDTLLDVLEDLFLEQ